MDVQDDIFANFDFGKIALIKLAPVAANFRLYEAGWIEDSDVMKVTGADFRNATRGKNKGKLTIPIPNTRRSAYVTVREIREFNIPKIKESSQGVEV